MTIKNIEERTNICLKIKNVQILMNWESLV